MKTCRARGASSPEATSTFHGAAALRLLRPSLRRFKIKPISSPLCLLSSSSSSSSWKFLFFGKDPLGSLGIRAESLLSANWGSRRRPASERLLIIHQRRLLLKLLSRRKRLIILICFFLLLSSTTIISERTSVSAFYPPGEILSNVQRIEAKRRGRVILSVFSRCKVNIREASDRMELDRNYQLFKTHVYSLPLGWGWGCWGVGVKASLNALVKSEAQVCLRL